MMSALTQRQAVMTLGTLKGLGPIRIGRLLDAFGGDAAAALFATTRRLEEIPDIGPGTAAVVTGWRDAFDPIREEETLAKMGARFLLKGEPGYPKRLAELPGVPHGLYAKGIFPEGPALAIVGTRRPTLYGRAQAKLFAGTLARAGITIVSGLARGIDGEAHAGALEGGRTAAFLGCGLDVIYPPEHAALYEKIAVNGAILTEFPLGRPPDAQTFPQRNRLISGSADAILVVESDEKGGSMITARCAGEQGRMIFALPGRVDQPSSRGCHALIRDGATLVAHPLQILDEIGPALGLSQQAPQQAELGLAAPALAGDEALVYALLADGALLSAEAAARAAGLSQQAALAALMMLEIRHLVRKRPDSTYEKR
jgi:DNA processing protein